MKNLQLLLVIILIVFSFQVFADASTLEKTKPLPAITIDEKVARVQAVYENLLEKFEFTDKKEAFSLNADDPFKLIAKTRILLQKRKELPQGLEKAKENFKCISSLTVTDILPHEQLCQANNLLPSDLEKNLDILLEEIDNVLEPTTWYDRFHSFYSLLALIVVSLAVISVLTWQFYKKSSAEDL